MYQCDVCPSSLGFTRPHQGASYYKFPPLIGAVGQADLLFVGINPRLRRNEALHGELMGSFEAFERLARNQVRSEPYIAVNGLERHYQAHMEIVEGVFGRGEKFEDHAAVTELFYCATPDSTGLPPVESRCADRHFGEVLRLVRPKVVLCVGARVFRYFASKRRNAAGVTFDGLRADLVRIPHPNARMSRLTRGDQISAAIQRVKGVVHAD